ncbi:hypothetical protein GCM10012284_25630 [Mangrovihabitans endophyticus]|uniref:Uncharacterized protein n=1 Tax=Mangrovihabitans endophyticus TaxID=1751298 RepID=A0A8J3BZV3_9ACTN|nr:hypothetical protein GCM10012284_25630 [Mangrovihabitans endophyticus]
MATQLRPAGADYFRVRVVTGSATTTIFTQSGAASDRAASWQSATVDLSAFAGQTVRIQVEAADEATASLVEAAVDDLMVTRA